MKKGLVFLAVGILAGCGQPPIPVFNAERVADNKADELAGNKWGKVEYAPKQYAGFAYDSTGVYGNLHGANRPEMILLRFHAPKGHKAMACREICLFASGLMFSAGPSFDSNVIRATPTDGLTEEQFKWLGQPKPMTAKQVSFAYGRTFWVSWKALGLDGPPAEGKLRVFIHAMQRKGTGASFLVGANTAQ